MLPNWIQSPNVTKRKIQFFSQNLAIFQRKVISSHIIPFTKQIALEKMLIPIHYSKFAHC
jgi:hypothetical protein